MTELSLEVGNVGVLTGEFYGGSGDEEEVIG